MDIKVKFTGGIGNQLFQLAYLLYMRRRFAARVSFIRTIDKNLSHDSSIEDLIDLDLLDVRESKRHLLDKKVDEVALRKLEFVNYSSFRQNLVTGYFQNWRYVWMVLEEIKLSLKGSVLLKKELLNVEENSIVCHFRGGDYFSNHMHYKKVGVVKRSYYDNAISLIRSTEAKDLHVLVVTDDEDRANEYFSSEDYLTQYKNSNGWLEDFITIGRAKHSVIPNSTFSWWSRILLAQSDSTTVIPSPWSKTLDEDLFSLEYPGLIAMHADYS